MPAPARILVIRGGAMGDFILTLPVLGALRRRFPAARLELLANAPYAPLAIATSLADDYRKLDAAEWASAFTLDTTLPPALHDWLSTESMALYNSSSIVSYGTITDINSLELEIVYKNAGLEETHSQVNYFQSF